MDQKVFTGAARAPTALSENRTRGYLGTINPWITLHVGSIHGLKSRYLPTH